MEKDSVHIREWERLLCEGAEEVFQMMVGIPLIRCAEGTCYQAGEFTAVVGVAGPINGVFEVRCDQNTACGIASGMLGVDTHEVQSDVCDALGEICNLVVGNFKNKMGKVGQSSVLSVPTLIHGRNYRVRPLVNGSIVECLMQTADGIIQFRFNYRLAAVQDPVDRPSIK